MNDIFTRGLHRLSAKQLIELADSQELLLSEVERQDLVYLVQELAFRLSDTLEAQASKHMLEGTTGKPVAGEYND